MTTTLRLPRADREIVPYTAGLHAPVPQSSGHFVSRVAYAAAHVVVDPLATADPTSAAAIDWDTTLAYRRYLWSCGLAVAEAMDTAQRGMGLSWPQASELIRHTAAEARACGGVVASGAGTDHLTPNSAVSCETILRAYAEQCAQVEAAGSRVIVMASRALAACAKGPDDYRSVYGTLLSQLQEPAILHWLGEAFDPALAGYWGSPDLDQATEVCLSIIWEHAARVDGIKVSLLDAERECAIRRRLPPGVRLYTGDDYHYPELIRGDAYRYSDALLGIFDAIAPAAAAALHALDAQDLDRYAAILEPTVPLARHIFAPPTSSYKTGIVFLAYLNGHQSHFRMLAGAESARSIVHLAQLFILADRAGVLRDPERAAARLSPLLTLAGVPA